MFHDPMVKSWQIDSTELTCEADLDEAIGQADVVVLLQAHESYNLERICQASNIMLDTRGIAPAPAIRL